MRTKIPYSEYNKSNPISGCFLFFDSCAARAAVSAFGELPSETGSVLEVIFLRRKNRNNGTCVFAAILLFFGLVCLCFVSYRFLLFLAAGIMIVIGIILIRRC